MEKKTIKRSLTSAILESGHTALTETEFLLKIDDAKARAQELGDIKSVHIDLFAYESYGDASAQLDIEIRTERHESAEEFMKRTEKAAKQATLKAKNLALREERQRTKDLEQLERLKAKYE